MIMDSRIAISDSEDNNSGSSSTTVLMSSPEEINSKSPEITALRKVSEDLHTLFQSPDFRAYSDAKIIVNEASGEEVCVHRCVLGARSPFFKALFGSGICCGEEFKLKELVKGGGGLDVGLEALIAVLGYLYSGKLRDLPRGVCVCVDESCSHEGCRPAVDFMVQVLIASFTFHIPELVALFQRCLLEILHKVATDDILIILSVAKKCDKDCEKLLSKCIEIITNSDLDIITLEKALPPDIVQEVMDSRTKLGSSAIEIKSIPDKHVKRVYRALDSDDVELLRMLLKEGHTNIDNSCALHYAVAHCDAKITTELLDLGIADVNHRNPRGFTVLHVAAMRREPKIIVSLLTKGAQPSDLTLDGRKAVEISKRLTRFVDYHKFAEEGKLSSKDRLCIEILEQAERQEPLMGEASVSLAMAGDDLRERLLYLENRVSLAKLLFPMEAQVAMEIAKVGGTQEFPLAINLKNFPNNHITEHVDLNQAPFKMEEKHLTRMRALSKTVELGKRFFPRCSEVLNKIMDADLSELAYYLANDTAEELMAKKRRYQELQDSLAKAFSEDQIEFNKSTAVEELSPSSSSSTTTTTAAGTVRAMRLNTFIGKK